MRTDLRFLVRLHKLAVQGCMKWRLGEFGDWGFAGLSVIDTLGGMKEH